jgi:hypothetical protein
LEAPFWLGYAGGARVLFIAAHRAPTIALLLPAHRAPSSTPRSYQHTVLLPADLLEGDYQFQRVADFLSLCLHGMMSQGAPQKIGLRFKTAHGVSTITDVTKGSAAKLAGIKVGEEILGMSNN